MSDFPKSGHSNRAYFTILNGCFRPIADIAGAIRGYGTRVRCYIRYDPDGE